MSNYKAICTVTFKFESDASHEDCLLYAKEQIERILDCDPYGEEFDGFSVQVDIAPMKERKKLVHIASYSVDEILSHVADTEEKHEYVVDGQSYHVRMNSDRYFVFRDSRVCVSCGLVGTQMILDLNPGDQAPHFNLYAEEYGRLVLMTKDHKIPKSKGGADELANYQPMCSTCNNLKGAYDLTLEDCRELRRLYKNEDKLPRKELRELINTIREQLTAKKE